MNKLLPLEGGYGRSYELLSEAMRSLDQSSGTWIEKLCDALDASSTSFVERIVEPLDEAYDLDRAEGRLLRAFAHRLGWWTVEGMSEALERRFFAQGLATFRPRKGRLDTFEDVLRMATGIPFVVSSAWGGVFTIGVSEFEVDEIAGPHESPGSGDFYFEETPIGEGEVGVGQTTFEQTYAPFEVTVRAPFPLGDLQNRQVTQIAARFLRAEDHVRVVWDGVREYWEVGTRETTTTTSVSGIILSDGFTMLQDGGEVAVLYEPSTPIEGSRVGLDMRVAPGYLEVERGRIGVEIIGPVPAKPFGLILSDGTEVRDGDEQ